MFGGNKKNTTPEMAAAMTPDGALTCVIAEGTKIEGTFTTSENVRLDGTIIGDVRCDKKLVMGANAKIEGNIRASNMTVMGKLVGNLTTQDTLHFMASADVTGDISANTLIVEEGAKYNGKLKINGKK